MERDSADARRTDDRNAANAGCFDFGCLPVIMFIGALIADLICSSWLRVVPITAYLVVIGLLFYGYYRKNLPFGALFSGLLVLSIDRIFSMLGVANLVSHLIRR